GMPKSTLSRRISELERHQGVQLLRRSTRQLSLTDVGRAFLVHCQELLAAAEAADQVTQFVQETPRGTVRISTPHQFSQLVLAPLVPAFMQRYPEVRLEFLVTNAAVDLLAEQVDIALRVRSRIDDSSLVARPLASGANHLYAQPALCERQGTPKVPDDLRDWPTLSVSFSSGRYQYEFTAADGTQTNVRHQPILISDDMGLLREAAGQGLGAVMLPEQLGDPWVRQGRLQRLLPDWQLPSGMLHLVYPSRRGLLPAVRVFIDFLVEHYQSHPIHPECA
ncbi:LysR family transcriptional regulator, partial [bacterium]|nr:LysR family transcriptional regulator [bacterium]